MLMIEEVTSIIRRGTCKDAGISPVLEAAILDLQNIVSVAGLRGSNKTVQLTCEYGRFQ